MRDDIQIAEFKKKINAKKYELASLRKELKNLKFEPEFFEDDYADFLNCEGSIIILDKEFLPSEVLKKMDPDTYKRGLIDYVSDFDIIESKKYKEIEEKIEDVESEIEELKEELESEIEDLQDEIEILVDEGEPTDTEENILDKLKNLRSTI